MSNTNDMARPVAALARRHWRSASLAIAVIGGATFAGDTIPSLLQDNDGTAGSAIALTPAPKPLSANDVSWLFPAPTKAADFANLISMRDLTAPNAQDPTKRDPVWQDDAFKQFLAIAASPAAQVAGTPSRIGLPAEVQAIEAWQVAGVRIDAGAPGFAKAVQAQFGQSPQIRLIIQPVTRNPDGTPNVHDITGHLIFSFLAGQDPPAQPGCSPRPKPDLVAFKQIVAELAALRTKLSAGQLGAHKIATAGTPLGVHPGLKDATTASHVRQEMLAFLQRHLSGERLTAMAIMGLPADAAAPWIFLSMVKVPAGAVPQLPDGGFIPVHGPTLDGQQFAEMLTPVGDAKRVVPSPHTNNLAPITCHHAALAAPTPAVDQRHGVATADLFDSASPRSQKVHNTLDVIADPTKSHFFNTDCVSCHTETRRAVELLKIKQLPGVDAKLLPNGPWNVRNFGWSPPIEGPVQGTVTHRTAAETAAVVNFMNAQLLGK
jgi:hypothetical protein